MSASSPRRAATGLALATLLLAAPGALRAQEDVITIRESTLQKFAAAMDPLHFERRAKLNLVINLLFDTVTITLCDDLAVADVDALQMKILPAQIWVSGSVRARWCGINAPPTPFTVLGTVRWDAGLRAIVMELPSVSVRPTVLGVAFPATVPVTPSLTLPPIPVDTSSLRVGTASGPRTLHATARDVSLSQANGKLEIRADVAVY